MRAREEGASNKKKIIMLYIAKILYAAIKYSEMNTLNAGERKKMHEKFKLCTTAEQVS